MASARRPKIGEVDIDFSTALAVIIGGGITYFGQGRLDARRADRESAREDTRAERELQREEAAAEAELRVAIRLLLEELDTLALHQAMLVEGGIYPKKPSSEGARLMFPTDAWESYKPTLARGLDDSAWKVLMPFMTTIPAVRASVFDAEPKSPIEPAVVERLRDGAQLASELYEILTGKPAPSMTARGEPAV